MHGQAVSALSHILQAKKSGDKLLVSIIKLLRQATYLCRPLNADTDITVDERSGLMKDINQNRPMITATESKAETIAWVQNRFDAMGCTIGCLHSFSSSSSPVQFQSLGFLLTLLQGGNVRVQTTVSMYLEHAGRSEPFFQTVWEILSDCLASIKTCKRSIKKQNRNAAVSDSEFWLDYATQLEQSFGKKSVGMMALRLLQIMCAGQYAPLQDLLSKQGNRSRNILKLVLEIFVCMQPIIEYSLTLSISSLAAFAIQCLATILDAARGAHAANREEILDSELFASFNRLFSSSWYQQEACKVLQKTDMGSEHSQIIFKRIVDPHDDKDSKSAKKVRKNKIGIVTGGDTSNGRDGGAAQDEEESSHPSSGNRDDLHVPCKFRVMQNSDVTANDMRCFLKTACVRICLNMFEAVNGPRVSLKAFL